MSPLLHTKRRKVVFVAMSGGVDSSVAAALLKRDSFDVVGVYMKCWLEGEQCSSSDDEKSARLAAAHLEIPFYSWNFIDEYQQKVAQYLIDGYKKGITPNPDTMCNREIKFGIFFEKALKLGTEFVATGHYARLCPAAGGAKAGQARTLLLQGKDKEKDQSYFLARINPQVLDRALFPIGEYTKTQVRQLAKKFGLPNAERKSSQGICFIGKVDFADFLKQYIPPKPGKIIDTVGKILGEHEGAFYYTIGQRKGIGLSGGPYYVVTKDLKRNVLQVSRDENDLYASEVKVANINWFLDADLRKPLKVEALLRYRQVPATSTFTLDVDKKSGTLKFSQPQRAVTPGQFAVMYQGETMVAGGVIE